MQPWLSDYYNQNLAIVNTNSGNCIGLMKISDWVTSQDGGRQEANVGYDTQGFPVTSIAPRSIVQIVTLLNQNEHKFSEATKCATRKAPVQNNSNLVTGHTAPT